MEYFLAVVENKGINGAAAALGVADQGMHEPSLAPKQKGSREGSLYVVRPAVSRW